MAAVLALALLPALAWLPGCAPEPRDPNVLIVAAATSLRDLLKETVAQFAPADQPVEVQFVFNSSSMLSRQAEGGADYDVLLFADEQCMDRLGHGVDASTRRTFLSNRLALVGRVGLPDPPTSPDRLPGRGLKLALAAPAVPAGHYAREYLERVGLLDALGPDIVNAEHVRAALAMVESGAADVGLVYLSDALAATSAQLLWTATAANNPDIVYVAAALSRSTSPWGDAFLKWLDGEEFQRAAEARGFLRPR